MFVNRRILIVDDNVDIHSDFQKILGANEKRGRSQLTSIEMELFADDEDDDPVVEDLPEGAQQHYELDFAYQGEEAVKMVSNAYKEGRPYALVFMDVRMPPGIDGIETISRIWKNHPNVEMVICTAYSDYSFDGVLEKLGSTDRLLFLTKPFDTIAVKQMALALSHKWTLHQQEQHQMKALETEAKQRRESQDRLHRMIYQDVITELGNRRQLGLSLKDAIGRAQKQRTRFTVFFLELDRFNDVIATLGYAMGDKLIRNIAERLSDAFDDEGLLFRQAEDEFCLLLSKLVSLAQCYQFAERIQKLFEPIFDLDDLNFGIGVNIGIVIYPDHGCSADMLMRHGDMTLVHAKHAENRYVFYDESMNRYSPQRLMLLTDLRHALLNDELMIYYQPKLAIQANQIVGVEALLRWPHPQMGFVPPLNFIPIAEQCGLIKPLTEWIFNRVCEQWTAWNEQGIALCISINLTAQDLQDESLTERVSKTLTRFEILPRFIGVEISEKGLMSDREQGTKTLKAIHDLGVRVTIDNFGTGYSSLAHLKNLPVDEIKIDQSFVDNLKDKPNEIAIVRSMVELGHNLGLDVIAEGVSTQRAFELLTEFHCDYVQGHHINPAVPAGELGLWLDESELWQPGKSM